MGAQFAIYCTIGLVRMSGDLDAGARGEAFDACCNSTGFAVVLDLSELTFLDTEGYAGIVDATRVLKSEGRTLTIRGIRGEPLRLLTLLGAPVDIEILVPLGSGRGLRSVA
jgi:anti-anti-sigma regulatory factor